MTTKVQAATLLLEARQELGATWREVAQVEKWGHGSCSRVLSDLHRTGHATRLEEKRDGCSVYVLVQYAGERDTVPFGARPGQQPADQLAVDTVAAETALRRQADEVERVIEQWGLDGSRFPSMWALASDLRHAVGRDRPNDGMTLPI